MYTAITGSMLQSDLAQTLGLKLVTFKEMFNLILVISIFILKTFDCYERMQKLIGRAS